MLNLGVLIFLLTSVVFTAIFDSHCRLTTYDFPQLLETNVSNPQMKICGVVGSGSPSLSPIPSGATPNKELQLL